MHTHGVAKNVLYSNVSDPSLESPKFHKGFCFSYCTVSCRTNVQIVDMGFYKFLFWMTVTILVMIFTYKIKYASVYFLDESLGGHENYFKNSRNTLFDEIIILFKKISRHFTVKLS